MQDPSQRDPRAYIQIAAAIRRQIAGHTLQPGDRVPSITALARGHGTARNTAAKAVQLLEREGLIFRVPGLGYHVSNSPAPGQPERVGQGQAGASPGHSG